MKIYSTWLDPNKWGPYIEEYQRQKESAMKDETLNAINDAIEALNLARKQLDAERVKTREDVRERLREKIDLGPPAEGFTWVVYDDPDAPRFRYSVAQIRREGDKLPEPTEEGRLLRAEPVKDGEEEGGS